MNTDSHPAAAQPDSGKLHFIVAFLDELDRKIERLGELADAEFTDEALTLSLVYIDGLAQRLMWPSNQSGANFVNALREFSGDVELGLIHPLQLNRAMDRMGEKLKPIARAVTETFPGPSYELLRERDVLDLLAPKLDAQQLKDLADAISRGSVARVVYEIMRNQAVHRLGAGTISFSGTMFAGRAAQELDFRRLQRAARNLSAEARRRSVATGQWFGNDLCVR
jgi:hypothetical protein